MSALGVRGRADRPAIDARGRNADEDAAVEARIAMEARLLAGLLVEVHGLILPGIVTLRLDHFATRSDSSQNEQPRCVYFSHII